MKAITVTLLLALVLLSGCSGPKGAGPDDVVPTVVGLRLVDAKSEIIDAGYRVGSITPKSASFDAIVSEQQPTAGSVEPRGSRIDLVVEGGY